MKTMSFWLALVALCAMTGCDHLRSSSAQAEDKEAKPTVAKSGTTLPPSDRYAGNGGAPN